MSGMLAKTMSGPDKPVDPFIYPFSYPFSLKKVFGKRWKIQMSEEWRYERPENKKGYEVWYEQIPTTCGGFIGLFQDKPVVILQIYTPKQRPTCRKLAEQFKGIPGVRLDDWFSGYESVLYFPVELFEQVAEAVGARKKRQGRPLTEAQRAAFAAGREKGMAALKKMRKSLLSGPPEIEDEAIPTQARG